MFSLFKKISEKDLPGILKSLEDVTVKATGSNYNKVEGHYNRGSEINISDLFVVPHYGDRTIIATPIEIKKKETKNEIIIKINIPYQRAQHAGKGDSDVYHDTLERIIKGVKKGG